MEFIVFSGDLPRMGGVISESGFHAVPGY